MQEKKDNMTSALMKIDMAPSSSHSILENGSLSGYWSIKGFKIGDLLSPFIFKMVAEGLRLSAGLLSRLGRLVCLKALRGWPEVRWSLIYN